MNMTPDNSACPHSTEKLDPITLALFQNRLDYVAKQMGWVMTRTARSPIFNQSHDFSCFIADRDGALVSQADGIPIHTGGGGFAVRAVLAAFPDAIHPGDVFLLSDPYEAGGNHLPDWVIARPVFVGDTRVAFACNRAHQSDIGGGAAYADTFVFSGGEGPEMDIIADFAPGVDTLDLTQAEDFFGFNDLTNGGDRYMYQVGDNTVIKYYDHSLTLNNVNMEDLSADDFLFF